MCASSSRSTSSPSASRSASAPATVATIAACGFHSVSDAPSIPKRSAVNPASFRARPSSISSSAVWPAQVDVDADAVARRPAEQRRDRHAERLALQIPQRDVDPGDGAHDHLAVRPERAAHHLAPPVLDLARVLPDEQLGEVVEHAEHRAPLPGQARLADAREALVGADEDDDHREPVVLGVALAVAAAEAAGVPADGDR